MRPRLLHVFPSFAIGGMQTQFATLANALGDGYGHAVVTLDGRMQCRAKLDAATPHEILAAPAGGAAGLRAAPAILRFLRRRAPDAVVTYNWGAIEWCAIARMAGVAPVIHAEHGFGPEEADRLLKRRNLFRRMALAGGVKLVVPSLALRDIARRHWGVADAAIRHIPNGIDIAGIERRAAAAPAPFARRPGALILGAVSPLVAVKDLGALLRIFAMIAADDARWRLVLAGDGPERPGLEAEAARLGVASRVAFLGSLDDPAPALALFDVLAMTSRSEQMPYAVLEAMALAKPVVATDVGDIAEMVAAQNRPLIRPRGDMAGLAAALRRLAADPALRVQLGEANRARCAAAYAEARMCAAYRRLYEEVVAAR
ncbi:MAG: glycosyltransferase [Rhodospirillales bacterium]|jgi:glycosyltransferase involved in cell wall biosynthesis